MSRQRMLSRRQFLRGLGGIAVGLPLLASFQAPASAQAQAVPSGKDGFPRRLLIFFHPNGVMPDAWWPTAGANERDFSLAASLQPLERFKSRMLLLRGVHLSSAASGPGGPHQKGMGHLLTGRALQSGTFVDGDGAMAGWADGVSFDQVVAEHVGRENRLKSLELGVRADASGGAEVRSRLCYGGPAQPLPPINDPRVTFDTLFSDFHTDPTALAELRARRLSVLDAVGDQFSHVYQRAGYEDRVRLQAHLDMIRDLELRLQNQGALPGTCTVPGRPIDQPEDDENTMPAIAALQTELMALALVCDITRVGSLQFSNAMNHIRFPWLQSFGDGHTLSHAGPSNTDAFQQWVARDRWFAEQIGHLLDTLDAVPEGSGTMLDNTCVLWVNELSQGNTHSHRNMPFVLIGSAGGAIDVGRYVQAPDTAHNDLLLAIMAAFGVERSTFGDPDFCTGPMPGVLV